MLSFLSLASVMNTVIIYFCILCGCFLQTGFQKYFENPHHDTLKQIDCILLENSPGSRTFFYLSGRTPTKLQLMSAGFETELPHKPHRAGQVSLVSTEAVASEASTLSSPAPSPLCPGERPGPGDSDADLSFTSRVLHFQGHAARQRAYPWLLTVRL